MNATNHRNARPVEARAHRFGRSRARVALAFLVAGLASLLSASSASALIIGTGWSGEPNFNVPEMVQVGKSGAQVFRVPFALPANLDWTADDQLVEAAALNGVTIHPGLGGGGGLPYGPDRTNWLNSLNAAVKRYGYNGTFWQEEKHKSVPYKPITTWEIWNEPNLEGIPAENMAQFVDENANAIQSASNAQAGRGTEVLFGGIFAWGNYGSLESALGYLTTAYAQIGFNSGVTGVAIHPYELEESTFFDPDGSGPTPRYNHIEAFKYAVARFHYKLVELAEATGTPQKNIWITEAGWPAEGPFSVNEGGQAVLLNLAFDYAKNNQGALNLAGMIWYNHRDIPSQGAWDDYCGLRAHDGRYRPSWVAFQAETGAAAWPPPAVSTGDAPELENTEVTLTGNVDPGGRPTNYRFEYGPTTAYGSSIPAPDQEAGSGGSLVVSKRLTGLIPRRHYHYRLVASNSFGSVYGADRTFTTGMRWSLRNSNSAGAPDARYWFGQPNESRVSGDWDGDGVSTVGSWDAASGTWRLTNNPAGGAPEIEFSYGGSNALPVTGDWDGNGTTTIGVYYPSTGIWDLRNSNSPGGAENSFQYGGSQFTPVTGDWDGNGTTTIGAFEPNSGTWNLRNTNNSGPADLSFSYGGSQFQPTTGDWDNNGTTTIGLYESSSGSWQLRNANSGGGADVSFNYASGGAPISGDWDGNGTSTVGVVEYNALVERAWLQRNSNAAGTPDASFYFGLQGESAVSGDWNGDGVVTAGVWLPATGTWKLTNSKTGGPAELEFQYGGSNALPVTGDWDKNGTTTIGVYYPSSGIWDLRNSNSPGGAEISFGYGGSPALPVTGDWDGNGTDTIGTFYPETGNWNLRNTNSAGGADLSFQYGGSQFQPVTGDWDGNGTTTIGLYETSSGSWQLRNANSAGGAQVSYSWGGGPWKALGGDWDGNGTSTPSLVATDADPSLPGVRTDGASSVEETQATMNGLVESMGYPTTYYFEYGTSTAYDAISPATPASTSASVQASVNASLPSGQPGTTYHYRLVAKNILGTVYGKDRTVTLPGYRYLAASSSGTTLSGWKTVLSQGLPLESISADFNGDGKADLINVDSEGSSGYRMRVGIGNGTGIASWAIAASEMPTPERFAAGDFSGDGKADVVSVESEGGGKYRYRLGTSNGTTVSAWSTIATGMALPSRLALGDFTGDGKADVLAVEPEAGGTYRYRLGTSAGTSISGWSTLRSGSDYPFKTSLADFNGDGKADLVSLEATAGTTSFRYMLGASNGTGITGWSQIIGGMSFPQRLGVGDFTGDGKADIVVEELESATLGRYMLGTSNGTGVSSWNSLATGVYLHGKMNLADFNGDKKADVMVLSTDGKGAYVHKAGISTGTTISSWETVQTWMNKPSSIKTGDFNGDGKVDILAAEPESSGNYRYRVGYGTGGLGVTYWRTITGGMTPPSSFGVGDVNADGKADVIALEPEGNGKYRYMFGISNGTGFSSWNNAIGGMSPVSWMQVGDLNGDKKADVAVVESEAGNKNRYMFGLSGGTSITSWTQALSGLSQPDKFAVGDVTGDGKADVMAAESEGTGNYRYMLGVSAGTNISSWTQVRSNMTHPSFMELGDVNADKKADIMAVEPETSSTDRFMFGISAGTTIPTWLNAQAAATQSNKFAAGDLNGDGKADGLRLEEVR